MSGYNQDILKEYVPALVYTMYDGYYIYSPFKNTLPAENSGGTYNNGEKISDFKPYIHYSMRYTKGTDLDVVITYTLDNYITVQGIVNGKGVNRSGYLIDGITTTGGGVQYRTINIDKENMLKECVGYDNSGNSITKSYVKINGVKYYQDEIDKTKWYTVLNGKQYDKQVINTDSYLEKDANDVEYNISAITYYREAYDFTNWIRTSVLKNLSTENAVDEDGNSLRDKFGNMKIFDGDNDNPIEEPNSNFNQHRLAVIRYTIEKNLSIAIANYNNYGGTTKANFAMPKLQEYEWEKLMDNICMISFLQGLNIGGKIYNGYSVVANTKNKEVVTEDSIYMVTNDETYHDVKEQNLTNVTQGVLNIDFERNLIIKEDGTMQYFFPRPELGSYDSIVTQNKVKTTENIYKYLNGLSGGGNLAKLYYTALGRERKAMYRPENM